MDNARATYNGGPADTELIPPARVEPVQQKPGGRTGGVGVGEDAGQVCADGRVVGSEDVEMEVAEGGMLEGDGDGLGSCEDGLFGVGCGWGDDD